MNKIVTINSRKLDNSLHRTWKCELIEETIDYWLFVGKFDREVSHNQLGVIKNGTITYEYYFKDKMFNIFRFHEPDGEFKFHYCNLNLPPKFEDKVLEYVDLEIDVLVKKDFTFEILDEDEYKDNSKRFGYSDQLKAQVEASLAELIEVIQTRKFPFCEHLQLL
jgi:uncharacterized protein